LITEAADISIIYGVLYGRGAFCRPMKVSWEGCWRYQKCECWHE